MKKDGLYTSNGHNFYYEKGLFHRENGPAVEYSWGTHYWYRHGELHRIDGPAAMYGPDRFEIAWYQNDLLHRLDGPAVQFGNRIEWWIDGRRIEGVKSQEEFGQYLKLKSFW